MSKGILFLGMVAAVVTSAPAASDVPLWQRNWKTDFSRQTIPSSEIVAGGPRVTEFRQSTSQDFEAAARTKRYGDREPVIELNIGSETRGYPLSVLTWHEIVNDVVGGRSVAVTYCPLCNASIVFDSSFREHRFSLSEQPVCYEIPD